MGAGAMAREIRRRMQAHGPRYGYVDVRGTAYRVRSLRPDREMGEFAVRLKLARMSHASRRMRRRLGIRGPAVPLEAWIAGRCMVDERGQPIYRGNEVADLADDGPLCIKVANRALELTGLRIKGGTVDFDPDAWPPVP